MDNDPALSPAQRWRMKAEELRAIGEQMQNPMARGSFRRMAETYEHPALLYEERAARDAARKSEVS